MKARRKGHVVTPVTLAPTPLYAPAGWTDRIGIPEILLSGREGPTPSFARFEALRAPQARTLLERMPAQALEDRQNRAPQLRHLLHACLAHPHLIELAGYVIGPGRFDERVSVDMVIVRSPWDATAEGTLDPTGLPHTSTLTKPWSNLPEAPTRDQLWETTCELLDLDPSHAIEPDEIEYLAPFAGAQGGWWVWWD